MKCTCLEDGVCVELVPSLYLCSNFVFNVALWSKQTMHPKRLSIAINSYVCNGNPAIGIWKSGIEKDNFICSHIALTLFKKCSYHATLLDLDWKAIFSWLSFAGRLALYLSKFSTLILGMFKSLMNWDCLIIVTGPVFCCNWCYSLAIEYRSFITN